MDENDLLKELRIDRSQRDGQGTSRPWPWAIVVVALLALAGAGIWWMQAPRALRVQTALAVAAAHAADGGAVLQATGYVTARRQATVSAQITGTLTEVRIEEGEHVGKGQVLARLEDSAQKAGLDAARADAAAARAQVVAARAQWLQARRDAQRQQGLAQRGLLAHQLAEQAVTRADALHAQLDARQKAYQVARAQMARARVSYGYTFVRAPFAGVITTKNAHIGEILSPLSAGGGFTRTGVGTIVDMNSLEVDVDVNESYIARIKAGMPTQAVLDAYPDWRIPAHVIAIVPAADRSKATVKVRVALDKKDARIVPDMGVRVSFLESQRRSAAAPPKGVLVPAAAVVERGGHKAVFVVADGVASLRRVRILPAAKGMKRVPEGLDAGARVVLSPPAGLRDGGRVKRKTSL